MEIVRIDNSNEVAVRFKVEKELTNGKYFGRVTQVQIDRDEGGMMIFFAVLDEDGNHYNEAVLHLEEHVKHNSVQETFVKMFGIDEDWYTERRMLEQTDRGIVAIAVRAESGKYPVVTDISDNICELGAYRYCC